MENTVIAIRKCSSNGNILIASSLFKELSIEGLEIAMAVLDAARLKLEIEHARLKEYEVNK